MTSGQRKAASGSGTCVYDARGISVSLQGNAHATVTVQGRSRRGSKFAEIHVIDATKAPADDLIRPLIAGGSHTTCAVGVASDPNGIVFGTKGGGGFIAVHVDNGIAFTLEGAAVDGKALAVRGWVERRAFGAQGSGSLRARLYIRSNAGDDTIRDVSGESPIVTTLDIPLPAKAGCADVGLLESGRIPQAQVCW